MKKLYRQFNRLGIDEEMEPMHVSEIEKERVKNKVMKRKKKHLPRILSAAIIFASIVTLSLTLSIAHPAFAEKLPIIGNIFDLFNDNGREYIFDNYDNHSTDLDITKESSGVSITLTEAVYDGENITIAYTIESEFDLGDEPLIDAQFSVENNYFPYFMGGSQVSEKINDKEYAGLYMIHLMEGEWPDTVQVNWDGEGIGSIDLETGEMKKSIEGNWPFELTLDAIESQTQEFENLVSKGEGMEVKLKQITSTPVSTSFYFREKVDRNLKGWEEEKWEGVIFDYEVSDNLGNKYNVVPNAAWGNNEYALESRVISSDIDEKATSLTITPIASIYKIKDDDVGEGEGFEGELVKDPFKLESIEVPLGKK